MHLILCYRGKWPRLCIQVLPPGTMEPPHAWLHPCHTPRWRGRLCCLTAQTRSRLVQSLSSPLQSSGLVFFITLLFFLIHKKVILEESRKIICPKRHYYIHCLEMALCTGKMMGGLAQGRGRQAAESEALSCRPQRSVWGAVWLRHLALHPRVLRPGCW